jgi:hypothetical protein
VSATEGENTENLTAQVAAYAAQQPQGSIFHTMPVQTPALGADVLTTYGDVPGADQASDGNNADFGFLGQLIDETYPEDETAVSGSLLDDLTKEDESHAPSLVVRAGQAIMEHPQIVAAPTGVIALGGLLGYFFSRKRKSGDLPEEPDGETIDEE